MPPIRPPTPDYGLSELGPLDTGGPAPPDAMMQRYRQMEQEGRLRSNYDRSPSAAPLPPPPGVRGNPGNPYGYDYPERGWKALSGSEIGPGTSGSTYRTYAPLSGSEIGPTPGSAYLPGAASARWAS